MKTKNNIYKLITCMLLILVSIFSFSACDVDGSLPKGTFESYGFEYKDATLGAILLEDVGNEEVAFNDYFIGDTTFNNLLDRQFETMSRLIYVLSNSKFGNEIVTNQELSASFYGSDIDITEDYINSIIDASSTGNTAMNIFATNSTKNNIQSEDSINTIKMNLVYIYLNTIMSSEQTSDLDLMAKISNADNVDLYTVYSSYNNIPYSNIGEASYDAMLGRMDELKISNMYYYNVLYYIGFTLYGEIFLNNVNDSTTEIINIVNSVVDNTVIMSETLEKKNESVTAQKEIFPTVLKCKLRYVEDVTEIYEGNELLKIKSIYYLNGLPTDTTHNEYKISSIILGLQAVSGQSFDVNFDVIAKYNDGTSYASDLTILADNSIVSDNKYKVTDANPEDTDFPFADNVFGNSKFASLEYNGTIKNKSNIQQDISDAVTSGKLNTFNELFEYNKSLDVFDLYYTKNYCGINFNYTKDGERITAQSCYCKALGLIVL